MSIFTRIKDAIFGHESPAEAGAPKPAPQSAPKPATTSGIPASPADAKWEREVDVEAVLELRAADNPQKLNWRSSIVDLMKLLDIDSSLANRRELARELGYTGSTEDTATMNVWLHKRVMEELRKNGGKVRRHWSPEPQPLSPPLFLPCSVDVVHLQLNESLEGQVLQAARFHLRDVLRRHAMHSQSDELIRIGLAQAHRDEPSRRTPV